jgi:hypothetical protein
MPHAHLARESLELVHRRTRSDPANIPRGLHFTVRPAPYMLSSSPKPTTPAPEAKPLPVDCAICQSPMVDPAVGGGTNRAPTYISKATCPAICSSLSRLWFLLFQDVRITFAKSATTRGQIAIRPAQHAARPSGASQSTWSTLASAAAKPRPSSPRATPRRTTLWPRPRLPPIAVPCVCKGQQGSRLQTVQQADAS